MKCQFCRDSNEPALEANVKCYRQGDAIFFSCEECLRKELSLTGDISDMVFDIPDSWELVPSDALAYVKKSNDENNEFRDFMSKYGDGLNLVTHRGTLHYTFTCITQRLESQLKKVKEDRSFLEHSFCSIGLSIPCRGIDNKFPQLSVSFCPDCGGPMIELRCAEAEYMFMDSGVRHDYYNHAKACLTCHIVFRGESLS